MKPVIRGASGEGAPLPALRTEVIGLNEFRFPEKEYTEYVNYYF
jgi:hypothetical protein